MTTRRTLLQGAAVAAVALILPAKAAGPPEPGLCDDPTVRKLLIRVRIHNLRTEVEALHDALPGLTRRQRAEVRERIAALRAQIAELRNALDDCDVEHGSRPGGKA